jgi:hypothetical protein
MGEIIDKRIFEIVADPATYQNKQTGFDDEDDSSLGYKMFCGKDDDGNITKMLAKGKPAEVESLYIIKDDFQYQFSNIGDLGRVVVTNPVSGTARMAFQDDILFNGGSGMLARFADSTQEVDDFISAYGNVSVFGALTNISPSGLDEDQILFGKADGTIEQSENFKFDDSNILVGDNTPISDGALHYGLEKHNDVDGSAMSLDGLVLVGETTGNEVVELHNTFDGTGYSLHLQDGIMCLFEVTVISAVSSADSYSAGVKISSRKIVCWNNAGYAPWNFGSDQEDIFAHSATWIPTISAVGDGNGNFNIKMTVTGTTGGEVITHTAKVRAITSQMSLISSS